MKTKLIYLIMLIICTSCGTNNKPVSDSQKEKIKGEVKEVVNNYIKGCEEANPSLVIETWLDSPDFAVQYNGKFYNYNECVNFVKSTFTVVLNQKGTIVDEKYAMIDKTTVLYTANTKWLMTLKDGQSILQDPWAVQLLFKKVENKWRIINSVESGIDNRVSSENAKGLDQAKLLMKWIGNFEGPLGKDSTQFVQFKSLPGEKVLSLYSKGVTKGKVIFEETGFWGYDASKNKIDLSVITSSGYVFHYLGEFTSPDKLEFYDVSGATGNKFIMERLSENEFKETTIVNNITTTRIAKRVK